MWSMYDSKYTQHAFSPISLKDSTMNDFKNRINDLRLSTDKHLTWADFLPQTIWIKE